MGGWVGGRGGEENREGLGEWELHTKEWCRLDGYITWSSRCFSLVITVTISSLTIAHVTI